MAYDSARGVSVLFGDAGDTWEWDGSNSTAQSGLKRVMGSER